MGMGKSPLEKVRVAKACDSLCAQIVNRAAHTGFDLFARNPDHGANKMSGAKTCAKPWQASLPLFWSFAAALRKHGVFNGKE